MANAPQHLILDILSQSKNVVLVVVIRIIIVHQIWNVFRVRLQPRVDMLLPNWIAKVAQHLIIILALSKHADNVQQIQLQVTLYR